MKRHLNLLPDTLKHARFFRRNMALWICLWLIGGMTAVLSLRYQSEAASIVQNKASLLEAKALPLQKMSHEIAQFEQELSQLKEPESRIWQFERTDTTLGRMGLLSHILQIFERHILIESITVQTTSVSSRKSLAIGGITTDQRSLDSFVGHLRRSNYFRSIEISRNKSPDGVNADARFQLECQYR